MRFRFYNFELGYDNGSTPLQGWSNKAYGTPSRWSGALNAQCVEVDVKDEKEYLEMAIDLKRAWHMPLRLWVPVPEFTQPLSHSVAEFQAGYNLGMDGRPLPDDASSNARAGYMAAFAISVEKEGDKPKVINGASLPDVKVIPADQVFPKDQIAVPIIGGTMSPELTEALKLGPAIERMGIPLSSMKFFTLRKVAKQEGVDISACEGVPQIIAAIEEHRKQPV